MENTQRPLSRLEIISAVSRIRSRGLGTTPLDSYTKSCLDAARGLNLLTSGEYEAISQMGASNVSIPLPPASTLPAPVAIGNVG